MVGYYSKEIFKIFLMIDFNFCSINAISTSIHKCIIGTSYSSYSPRNGSTFHALFNAKFIDFDLFSRNFFLFSSVMILIQNSLKKMKFNCVKIDSYFVRRIGIDILKRIITYHASRIRWLALSRYIARARFSKYFTKKKISEKQYFIFSFFLILSSYFW